MLLGIVLAGVVGSQLCVKAGLMRSGGVSLEGGQAWPSLLRTLREPLLWAGVGCTFVAGLTWLAVLGRLRLSVAFPFLGLSYVLMLPAARLLYREPISWIQVAGAALVCGGVVLIGSNR